MTEKLLKQIIKEAINNVLNEELNPNTFWTVPYGKSPEAIDKIKKMIAQRNNIDVSDLKIDGNKIIYSPSKKRKSAKPASAPKEKIRKPEGMDFDTFYERMVLPNNPEEQKKYALYGDSEKWMPVPNKGRFFKGELDPSQCVEVSNMGRVRFIDGNDALKSGINKGVYFAPTRNGVQVHINAIGADGKPLRTTGLLANMVIDAWFDPEGEFDKNKYKVIYLDGNPQNCRLDNLDYVPIERGRKRKTNQDDTTVESMANRISKMIIENLKRF